MELLRRATGRIPKVGLLPGVKIGSNAGKMPAFLFLDSCAGAAVTERAGAFVQLRNSALFCAHGICCKRMRLDGLSLDAVAISIHQGSYLREAAGVHFLRCCGAE